MIYQSIADIFAANEQANERFSAAISSLTEAQENFRPVADRWTIAEIAEHVATVNGGFLRITGKLLKQAEAEGKPAPAQLNLKPTALDESGNPLPPFQAPDAVKPQGGKPVSESLPKLREALDGLGALQDRLASVDLSEQRFPHPAFGPLSAYQWLILLSEHMDRHRSQIETIKAAPGFPA